jgi:hypothetical protein
MPTRPPVVKVKEAIEIAHLTLIGHKKLIPHSRERSWSEFCRFINNNLNTNWSSKRITAEINRVKIALEAARKADPENADSYRLPKRLPSDYRVIAKRRIDREANALIESLKS